MAKCQLHESMTEWIDKNEQRTMAVESRVNQISNEVTIMKTQKADTDAVIKWAATIGGAILSACGIAVVMLFARIGSQISAIAAQVK